MAVQWGNYADYCGPSKIPGSSTHVPDPRLALLDLLVPGLFAAKTCLDIGCNAGAVSCHLAFEFHAASVVGVDIDANLIRQAKKLHALRASRVRPPGGDTDHVVDYYPISAVLNHGYRIEPESDASRRTCSTAISRNWPHLRFFAADWLASDIREILGPYQVILALSVVKWLHLEHLDQGLESFFRKCSSSLISGGYLVIELQTWDSYQKAVRPNVAPHFRQNLAKLRHRPETSFSTLLAEQGFTLRASSSKLPRRIDVFQKV